MNLHKEALHAIFKFFTDTFGDAALPYIEKTNLPPIVKELYDEWRGQQE